MTTMIERVARALCKQHGVVDHSPVGWQWYEPMAHAAIKEMREPTEGMIAAGSRQRPFNEDDTDYDGMAYRENTDGTWQAMIDAALKEES